jgi:hypothetical protein
VVAKTCIIYQLYWLIEFGLLWVLNFVHNFANVEWDIFTKRKCRKNWMDPVYVMRCLSAKKIIIIVKDLVLWSRHDFFFVLIFIPFILHGLSPLIYSHSNLTITKNTGVGLNLYIFVHPYVMLPRHLRISEPEEQKSLTVEHFIHDVAPWNIS